MTLAPRSKKRVPAAKQARKGDRTRAEILDAAERLFAESGYRATSLQAVAEAVNITQPGLLYHFPSKEALLLALLADREEPILDEDVQGLDLLPSLAAFFRDSLDNPLLVRLFTVVILEGLAADHPAHLYVRERYANVHAQLVRRLRAGVADGTVSPSADLELDTVLLNAAIDGLCIQWLLDPDIDIARAFERLTAMLRLDLTCPQEDPAAPVP